MNKMSRAQELWHEGTAKERDSTSSHKATEGRSNSELSRKSDHGNCESYGRSVITPRSRGLSGPSEAFFPPSSIQS